MNRTFFFNLLTVSVLMLTLSTTYSQEKKVYKVSAIAFYNLENLFDTIAQPNDKEFTPDGVNKWNTERYNIKMKNMSDVISQIGNEMFPGGPAILGVCEIENKSVLEDLVNTPTLKASGYDIVHYDSPDRRGVDVGMIYRTEFFKVTSSRSARLNIPSSSDFKTRDQLVVSGLLDEESVHIIVNHWPSRRGGEKTSSPFRLAAAGLTRSIVDSILNTDPNAKIIVMGDLNDDPVNESVIDVLRAKPATKKLKSGDLFNPMAELYQQGIGSLAYRDSWNLFDNLIISQGLLKKDKSTWVFHKAKVFNKPFLQQSSGQYAGYPFRTYVGNNFTGGYSDHFPVYLFLIKEKNK